MQITADLLVRAMRCTRGSALTWAKPLNEACLQYGITSPARIAAFLAQIGHESAGLTRTVENLNYRAEGLLRTWPSRFDAQKAADLAMKPEAIANHVYGGRMGNYQPGDGYRYRGRGLIQVTGRLNYEAVRDLLQARLRDVPDLVALPETLAEPKWAALSAAAYWHDHRLNELADAGDFDHITRRINGGTIGMADRQKRYEQAKQALA
jgi:putative chitinase